MTRAQSVDYFGVLVPASVADRLRALSRRDARWYLSRRFDLQRAFWAEFEYRLTLAFWAPSKRRPRP